MPIDPDNDPNEAYETVPADTMIVGVTDIRGCWFAWHRSYLGANC